LHLQATESIVLQSESEKPLSLRTYTRFSAFNRSRYRDRSL